MDDEQPDDAVTGTDERHRDPWTLISLGREGSRFGILQEILASQKGTRVVAHV
jgi:hypothetical protein